eukprot:2094008-Pyramimonas_sp.AAC.1
MVENVRFGHVPRLVRWNREALMQSLGCGQGRADFLLELEAYMRSTEDAWKQIQREEQTPNNDWCSFMEALLTIGSKHFAKSPEY